MLGEVISERIKDRSIQVLYRDADGLSPHGILRCPEKTVPYCSCREPALLKPMAKVIEIRPGWTRGVRRPRLLPFEIGLEHTALLRYKVRKDGSNMLSKSGTWIA